MRRVVVTGAGVLSALGDSPEALHAALCQGRSGLRPIELSETAKLGCQQDGEIRNFAPRTYLGEANLRPRGDAQVKGDQNARAKGDCRKQSPALRKYGST